MNARIGLIVIIIICGDFSHQIMAQYVNPDSVSVKRVNYDYSDTTLFTSKKAIGGSIFLGQGFYSGNISQYFSNPFFIGLSIDIHRNNFIIQIDDYIGLGKTRQTMIFPDQSRWEENEGALSILIGCNIGYSLIDKKNFKFVTMGGIGINALRSSLIINDYSGNEPFLPYYKIGVFIDLKSIGFPKEHVRINNDDKDYTGIRLSSGITLPIGKPEYSDYYHGSMIYFTIGIGGFSRQYGKK